MPAMAQQQPGDTIVRTNSPGTFFGVAYAYYDDDLTAANFLASETFYDAGGDVVASESFQTNGGYAITLNGALWQSKTVNADGSYQLYIGVAGVFYGVAYAGYTQSFDATGFRNLTTIYDAQGNVVATQTYAQNGGFSITLNGALYYAYTVNPDGSYDEHYGLAGTYYGVAYASYTESFDATGFLDLMTIYDAQGHVVATQTYAQNGGVAVTLNGAVYYSRTINGDGSVDIVHGMAGTFYGVAYASYDENYDPTGFRDLVTLYDANGDVVASQSFKADGSSAITLNGVLYYAISYHGDGSYDVYSQAQGAFFGQTYTASDATYSATGVLESAIFYNGSGIVLSQQFQSNGISSVALGPDFLNNVTSDYLNGLSPAEVYALSASDLGAMPSTAFSGVTVAFVQNLSVAAMAGMTADQLSALPAAALAALNPAQLAGLPVDQNFAMTAADLQGFDPAFWNSNEWVTLGPAWMAALSAQSPPAALAGLTPAMFASVDIWPDISASAMSEIPTATLAAAGAAALLALTSDQIAALTQAQVEAIASANPPGFWSSVPATWLNSLSGDGLSGISGAALAMLQPATVGLLSAAAFQALEPIWSSLTPAQTAVLTPTQFGNLSVNDPNVFAQLTYPSALNVAVVTELDDTLLASLPSKEFSTFDAQWINVLPAGALDKLDEDQIQAILPQYFAYMNASIVGSLTTAQIGDLTAAQLAEFTPADFRALSSTQLQALPTADIPYLTLNQLAFVDISNFSPSQVSDSAALQYLEGQTITSSDFRTLSLSSLTGAEIQGISPTVLYQMTSFPDASDSIVEFFTPTQLLDMTGQQFSLIYNYLTQTQHQNFELQAVQSSPADIGFLASGWNSGAYGTGTLGDPKIWPYLSAAQVEAISNSGAIAANGLTTAVMGIAGVASSQQDEADALNTYDDLLSLPDSAFAGLGQGPGSPDTLAFLIAESYIVGELPADKVDAIAPSAWQAGVAELDDELTALQEPSFYGSLAYAAFTFNDPSTTWYVNQEIATNGPGWLPADPATLTVAALGALSAKKVQSFTTGQLYALSAAQYAAIYPDLTPAQTQQLLSLELLTLPPTVLTSFLNAGGLSSDIQTLLDPSATLGQLFSGAFTTADQVAAQQLISIYDQYFPIISKTPDQFKQLTTLYDLLETRSSALIANANITTQITSDVDSILNDFTLYNEGLTPAATPSDGRTDVDDYVETVDGALNQTVGGIVSLESDLKGLAGIVSNVDGLVLDNTTEATPLTALVQWALNGSPNANTPAGQGNLTYDNVSGLTFQTALENVELQLFTNADNFVKEDETGIGAVLAGQKEASQTALINNILDIVGAVASLGVGLGDAVGAVAAIGDVAEGAADVFKTVQTLEKVETEAESASSVLGGIASSFLTTLSNVSETADYSLAFETPSSNGQYYNLSDGGNYLSAFVDDLASTLTSGDATAQSAIQAAQAFSSDYKTLLSTIVTSLSDQSTTLAQWGLDAGPNFSQELDNIVKSIPDVPDAEVFDTTVYDSSTYQIGPDPTLPLPTDVPISYTDPNGATQVVNLNLAAILGNESNVLYLAGNGSDPNDSGAVGDPGSSIAADGWLDNGPAIPGYAATRIGLRLVLDNSSEPIAGDVWQINALTVYGENPV